MKKGLFAAGAFALLALPNVATDLADIQRMASELWGTLLAGWLTTPYCGRCSRACTRPSKPAAGSMSL